MSKKASNTTIGAFVVGAVALICLAVAVFGSGKLFKQTLEFVVFFDKSINGLNIGSPVVLQGVPIGRVFNINLDRDDETLSYKIPVYIEIDTKKVGTQLASAITKDQQETYLNKLVANGLRAQLAQQSLLTGQLMIELNFFAPQDLNQNLTSISYYKEYPIIPSISSTFDTLLEQVSHIPLKDIAQNVLIITERINAILARPDVQLLPQEAGKLIVQAQQMFASVSDLSANSATLAANMDKEIASVLAQLNSAIGEMSNIFNPTGIQMIELNQVLKDLGDAANAVRALAEMLNRHPESILQGRGITE